jgi:uncharacterized protein (DUF4415 family)
MIDDRKNHGETRYIAVPFTKLPTSLRETLSSRRRGPQQTPTKLRVTLRLSPQAVQHCKAGGPGWQTRIDLDPLGKIGAGNKGQVATASAPRRRMKAKAA